MERFYLLSIHKESNNSKSIKERLAGADENFVEIPIVHPCEISTCALPSYFPLSLFVFLEDRRDEVASQLRFGAAGLLDGIDARICKTVGRLAWTIEGKRMPDEAERA